MQSDREYPPRPMVGVAALILDGGRVLLVKRKNPPNEGLWSLPGGLVEIGESLEEALSRELMEELNIRVKIGNLFEVANAVQLNAEGKARYHFVIIDYLARPVDRKVRLNPESTASGWFTMEEVKGLDMSEGTRAVVLRCLKGIGKRSTGRRLAPELTFQRSSSSPTAKRPARKRSSSA